MFVISRILLDLVGILAMFYFLPAYRLGPVRDLRYHKTQPAPLEMWARWDSEWFLLVAEQGYDSAEIYSRFGGGKYLQQESAKVFPAYPLLIRIVSVILRNSVLAGFLISNAAAIIFLYYLRRLALKYLSEEAADSAAMLYIVFPTSFFLSAVYSESLFLAATAAAFFYIEERRLLPAAIACGIAVLARSQAVMIAPALLWLAWLRFENKKIPAVAAIALAMALPLAAYLVFVHRTFGSIRWIPESIAYWRGGMKYPGYAITRFFQSDIAIHGQHNSLIDFSFAIVNIAALFFVRRILPWPYVLFSAIAVLFPLSSTLFSFSRLCLANFPMFLFFGSLIKVENRPPVLVSSAILLSFFMAAFALWYWVA